MISVEARGRLGNHFFQFAFGLAASARLDTDFAMNDQLLRPLCSLGPWGSTMRRARRSASFRLANRFQPYPVVKVDGDADPEAVLDSIADNVHYAGFFQSDRYFAGVQAAVRAAFEPRTTHARVFRERYAELLRSPYACCHVRRTDYESADLHLPTSYYRECLRRAALRPGTPIVFVGDDLREVAREFGQAGGVRFERNEEIVDFQLLTNASVVVTSNSTFGWWGSWLGSTGRPIYAPRHWLGFRQGTEWPRAIIPAAWTQVAVPVEG